MKNIFLKACVIAVGLSCSIVAAAETLKDEWLRLVAGAENLRITAINTPKKPDPVVVELTDAASVEAFSSRVEFVPEAAVPGPAPRDPDVFEIPKTNCRCMGQYRLEFRRRDQTIATVTLHHFEHLRGAQLNRGMDATLTEPARAFLRELLRPKSG